MQFACDVIPRVNGSLPTVRTLAVDPLGRWIASGGSDTTVRLWPMPDLSKPPLHTLPREELIAKLKALTKTASSATRTPLPAGCSRWGRFPDGRPGRRGDALGVSTRRKGEAHPVSKTGTP